MKNPQQRAKEFLILKLRDAKVAQVQLKAVKKETNLEGYYGLVEYGKSLDNHVNTLESLLNTEE